MAAGSGLVIARIVCQPAFSSFVSAGRWRILRNRDMNLRAEPTTNEPGGNMKKSSLLLAMCIVLLALASPSTLADEQKSSKELKKDSQRAKINEVADETLQRLFAENAKAKDLYDAAVGWAVFDNTKVAFGVSGGGGSGVAVDKGSGNRVYMKMGTGGVGFGLGVNKFQVVFLFQDQQTLESFIDKGWLADAGATASAGTEAAEAKTGFKNGLALYQLTEKGLMLNADIAGTKYWKHDKLNE
jgi:lipid-binding SYLF domain-containing protein